MNTYNIAFFADSHLGYRAKVRSNEQGINIRVQDGYDAFRETVEQIITCKDKVDAVVHGGDLFHYSKPTIRDIATAQFYLRELAKRDIPFYGLAGNHDATDIRSELAAVAAVNDPDKKIFALYEPYMQYELTDGIVLHSVSHHGLGAEEAPKVKPVNGVLNLFTTHGAALDPKNQNLMRCADSPREQMVPIELIIDDAFVEDPAAVKKVLFCSGKLYFELADKQAKENRKDIAIVRLEQIYPLPVQQLDNLYKKYNKATWFWVQEEPLNMGAATFLQTNLKTINFGVISRNASAATATGYAKVHAQEQLEIIETAFNI